MKRINLSYYRFRANMKLLPKMETIFEEAVEPKTLREWDNWMDSYWGQWADIEPKTPPMSPKLPKQVRFKN